MTTTTSMRFCVSQDTYRCVQEWEAEAGVQVQEWEDTTTPINTSMVQQPQPQLSILERNFDWAYGYNMALIDRHSFTNFMHPLTQYVNLSLYFDFNTNIIIPFCMIIIPFVSTL